MVLMIRIGFETSLYRLTLPISHKNTMILRPDFTGQPNDHLPSRPAKGMMEHQNLAFEVNIRLMVRMNAMTAGVKYSFSSVEGHISLRKYRSNEKTSNVSCLPRNSGAAHNRRTQALSYVAFDGDGVVWSS